MGERKTRLAILTIAVVLMASLGWAASIYGKRACVDEAGHSAICTDDPGNYHECRATDGFGRCPDDPVCYDSRAPTQTSCIGKVVLATARCVDNSATASLTPDQACSAHGGVSVRYVSP